jgi:diamine N-acetyltransferase
VVAAETPSGVHTERVSKGNVTAVRQITVHPEQQKHVANITDSLIQASFLRGWNGFALKDGQSVVGFGSYADYEKVPGAAKIYKMIVDKDQQGKGYGTKLLDLLIEEIGHKNIWIDLHSDNTVARKVYAKRFDLVSDDGITAIMKLR